jgi:transposase-like protein
VGVRFPRATRQVVISIAGEPYWLWRAVDQHGFVLDVLVQRRRDSFAARRLMTKLLKAAVTPPRVMITDKLRSYGAALAKMGLRIDHRQHKGFTWGGLGSRGCNLIVYGRFPFRSFSASKV